MSAAGLKTAVLAMASLLLASAPATWADNAGSNKVGFGTSSKGVANPMVAGWVYGTCASVSYTLSGTSFVVKVINTDNSWASAASKTSAATVAQLMLIRACSRAGAYWGFYSTGTSWTTAIAY